MSEHTELRDLLQSQMDRSIKLPRNTDVQTAAPPTPISIRTDVDFSQWQVLANGKFRPGSKTRESLPSGTYSLGQDDFGPYLETLAVSSDHLMILPEPAHLRVLYSIQKFWDSCDRYNSYGLLYKRGILLWGPPGGGKTVTLQLLAREIIERHKGIVLCVTNPNLAIIVLKFLRLIEPHRPIIVILEDVDEIVMSYGEHGLLSILDGEHQTDNVVYLATTNYPERLGARIINRPSRFDERIKIGMPSPESRRAYLEKIVSSYKSSIQVDLEEWVEDTRGLSIAHLRELAVAVLCLDQPYSEVVERLRSMKIIPKPEDGFKKPQLGLAQYSGTTNNAKY